MRYGLRLGCRFGAPHDFKTVHETMHAKWEVCVKCNIKKRYVKGYKGRMKNTEYLKDHVRNFAQKFGATKRVYNRVYYPEKTTIVL